MAINPAPHTVGQHSTKAVLNANWAQVAALQADLEGGVFGGHAVVMFPPSGNPTGAGTVVDAFGNDVDTTGTTSQGLQEAINYSIANGQSLRVYGQGPHVIATRTGTTSNLSAIVTGLSSTSDLLAGDYVTAIVGGGGGTGIPSFTQIL